MAPASRHRAANPAAADLICIEFEGTILMRNLAPAPRHGDGGPMLDRSAYTLLMRLEVEGPMSVGELSDAFGLEVSTVHRQTAAMLRQGLVDRIPDPEGGVARKFRVSDEGAERLEADRRLKLNGLGQVLADWSPEDVHLLASMLTRFNAAIEDRDGRPWPRPGDSEG